MGSWLGTALEVMFKMKGRGRTDVRREAHCGQIHLICFFPHLPTLTPTRQREALTSCSMPSQDARHMSVTLDKAVTSSKEHRKPWAKINSPPLSSFLGYFVMAMKRWLPHTHIHTCTYKHTRIHIHIHIYTQTHVRTYRHAHTYTHIHTHICTHIYTHIHLYTHIYTYTYTHTYIHTWTHTLIHAVKSWDSASHL